jgi:hypothetical protein
LSKLEDFLARAKQRTISFIRSFAPFSMNNSPKILAPSQSAACLTCFFAFSGLYHFTIDAIKWKCKRWGKCFRLPFRRCLIGITTVFIFDWMEVEVEMEMEVHLFCFFIVLQANVSLD